MTSDVLRVATDARSRSLGAFSPSFNIHKLLFDNLEKFLPDDAHMRCSGKLHISMTRVHDGKNVVVSYPILILSTTLLIRYQINYER